MRWLKLLVYLALSYVVLSLSLPRLGIWVRLARGPVGWVPDPPNPLVWIVLALFTLLFLVGLAADVGLGLWKVPLPACALMVAVFGLALFAYRMEPSGRLLWRAEPFDAVPAQRLSQGLQALQRGLGEHFRTHGAFPTRKAELEAMLKEEDLAVSPYLHSGLRRGKAAVMVIEEAWGPLLHPGEDVLPGTYVYSVSADAKAYWLTAVAGVGAPAEPVMLATASGRPAVLSNLPGGS
ncbi:MAG: hypothetical protein ACOCVR_01685 [Myxococcota bacterium]